MSRRCCFYRWREYWQLGSQEAHFEGRKLDPSTIANASPANHWQHCRRLAARLIDIPHLRASKFNQKINFHDQFCAAKKCKIKFVPSTICSNCRFNLFGCKLMNSDENDDNFRRIIPSAGKSYQCFRCNNQRLWRSHGNRISETIHRI